MTLAIGFGGECVPFDCAGNNGNMYKNNKVCQSTKCARKAQACRFTCMGSGGWSGI